MQKYLVKNEAESEITLRVHGEIDEYGQYFGGTSAEMVIGEIEASNPKTIKVSINSGGGSVFEGLVIYNYLKDFKGNVKVEIDGLAASMASVIAQAGNTITMKEGSLMMIHDPLTIAMGNADEMRKVADMLDKVGGSLADIYKSNNRKDKSKADILGLMNAETWMTAQEAVELGFADRYREGKKNMTSTQAMLKMAARFNVPDRLVNQLNNNSNMSTENQSWLEGFKNFFKTNKEMEEVKNELVAPVKNELEAKLQAEQEAKAAIEAKLAEAQTKAEQVEALQAKIDALEAQANEAAKPQVTPSADLSESQEEETVMSEKQKLEASLLAGFSDSKKQEYAAVKARAEKIQQIKDKAKQ